MSESGEHEGLLRRELIALGGAVGALAYLEGADAFAAQAPPFTDTQPINTKVPQFSVTVRRREDLLWLRFTFVNLKFKAGTRPTLIKAKSSKPAYVIVGFVPQHLAEEAYKLTGSSSTTEKPKTPGKSRARLAASSRLAFKVPSSVKEIPYDLEHLLAWTAWTPNLAPAATTTKKTKRSILRAPKSTETAIELPWRLAISPGSLGYWEHEINAISHGGWTELWQTRLASLQVVPPLGAAITAGTRAAPPPSGPIKQTQYERIDGGPIRAIWAYDNGFKKTGSPPSKDTSPFHPFRTSLDTRDRTQIVRSSADNNYSARKDVKATRLWLSSLGGFLDARGEWKPKSPLNLIEWRHIATLARDHYVRVIEKGYLWPFGHGAVKIKITERKFEKVGTSKVLAVMRQREFVVVRQQTKSYVDSYGVTNNSRDLPFRELTFTTLVSPNLDDGVAFGTPDSFVPKVGGVAFRWHLVGTDWVGRPLDFTVPAVFVTSPDGYKETQAKKVRDAYNALAVDDDIRVGIFNGQTIALAESVKDGDTDAEIKTITFGARAGSTGTDTAYEDHDQGRCYPTLTQGEVRLSAAEAASGGTAFSKTPILEYDTVYVSGGFSDAVNKGKVFVKVKSSSVPTMTFGEGSGGAVLTPNIAIGGLSRSLGPVGGNSDIVRGGSFDPKEFFKGVEAKILGGVDLLEVFLSQALSGDTAPDSAMRLTYQTTADAIETRLRWKPTPDPSHPVIKTTGASKFELDALLRADLKDPSKSTYDVRGDLRSFDVSLIGDSAPAQFVLLKFNALTFTAKTGQDADIDVDLAEVQFKGVLEFVDKLREYLDFSQEGGPAIDVTPTGISADLSVPIPSIQVGVFALSNLAFIAGFNLPFDGDPARFRFGFSTREDMFHIAVSIFGGGGFFSLAIGTDGVESIEAALEFGAMCEIDVGVASGGVHLMAGVYFSYGTDDQHPEPTCVLTGYVRLGGELDVLGIITLSLEFYMGLTYESGPPKKVYGQATLTVEIDVLIFSGSVDITVERQFGGEDGDPTFAQELPAPSYWADYCNAFAVN